MIVIDLILLTSKSPFWELTSSKRLIFLIEVTIHVFRHINIGTKRQQIHVRHTNRLIYVRARLLSESPNRSRWFSQGATPRALSLKVWSIRQWSNVRRCSRMVAGHQQSAHTPSVPSGSWSPCVPLVWNQGVPTLLDGSCVSANLVKEPDIRFSSSRFRTNSRGARRQWIEIPWQWLYMHTHT